MIAWIAWLTVGPGAALAPIAADRCRARPRSAAARAETSDDDTRLATDLFRAWAQPRENATFSVVEAPPDGRDAQLRRFATATAFADDLVTVNAANIACRAGRLRVNGLKSSGARRVAPGDRLTLARPPERRTDLPTDVDAAARWVGKRQRLAAALRDDARHAPALRILFEDDSLAVVLKPAGVHAMSWTGTLKRRELCLDDVLPLARTRVRA